MTKTDVLTNETMTKVGVELVDFWAPWCGPCRVMGPIVDSIKQKNKDISVEKVNVDDSQDLAAKYQIRSIPTLLFFKNGNVVDRIVGLKSEAEIQDIIDDLRS